MQGLPRKPMPYPNSCLSRLLQTRFGSRRFALFGVDRAIWTGIPAPGPVRHKHTDLVILHCESESSGNPCVRRLRSYLERTACAPTLHVIQQGLKIHIDFYDSLWMPKLLRRVLLSINQNSLLVVRQKGSCRLHRSQGSLANQMPKVLQEYNQ
jgi:hypothetical protein